MQDTRYTCSPDLSRKNDNMPCTLPLIAHLLLSSWETGPAKLAIWPVFFSSQIARGHGYARVKLCKSDIQTGLGNFKPRETVVLKRGWWIGRGGEGLTVKRVDFGYNLTSSTLIAVVVVADAAAVVAVQEHLSNLLKLLKLLVQFVRYHCRLTVL